MACLLFCLVLAIVIQKTEEQNPESGMAGGVAEICYNGVVDGKRGRGRPKRRWIDNIKEWKEPKSTYYDSTSKVDTKGISRQYITRSNTITVQNVQA